MPTATKKKLLPAMPSAKVEPTPEQTPDEEDLHDPAAAARAAHLHYVSDSSPGFSRVRTRDSKNWTFLDTRGKPITDEATIARIRKLAIPPAYEDVWICKDPNGHLQAVGRDARGRKQYRYHPRWRVVRDEAKFNKMLVFSRVLPAVRAQVRHDLALPGLPKRRVTAAVVALLDKTNMRIGNEEYARTNQSYGLTTLHHEHAHVEGTHVVLDFRGKHGVEHHIDLQDRRLANIVHKLEELRGQDLFQFIDHDGHSHGLTSDDVNEYLHQVSGEEITAKDFRTWAGTKLAAVMLAAFERFDSEAKNKKEIVRAVEAVAKQLGNTPAICRKCYVHPAVLDGFLDGSLLEAIKAETDQLLDHPESGGLSAEEVAVTAFLSRRLDEAIHSPTHVLEST